MISLFYTDEQQSRILNSLRFPLACMVVIIHCKINEKTWIMPEWDNITGPEILTAIQILFSNIICGIAVPIFFILSGYFFFYRTKNFTKEIYYTKIKKRIYTLFIPYIIWNLLYILTITMRKVIACLIKDRPLSSVITFFDEKGWIRLFWDSEIWGRNNINILGQEIFSTGPILIPMWFLRDLIIVIFISPIIYIGIRHLKYWSIIFLAGCYFTGIWCYNFHGLSITAVFFFSIGAYFSIYNLNILNELIRYKKIAFILWIPFIILLMYFNGNYTTEGRYLYPFYVIIGIICTINFAASLTERKQQKLSKLGEGRTTFFIYAFHGLIGLTISSIILKILLPPINYWPYAILYYLIKPILTIIICLICFYLMKKYIPQALNILTGDYNKNKYYIH